jgi:Mannosyl-glycoprotein endo-beta-N-acetylglucosaminidase
MAGGGLLDDGSTGWDIDPSLLATMASDAGVPTWTPPADTPPPDATVTPAPAQPPATMADTGGGFWHDLASGIGQAGTALGGGLDPSITGDARTVAGQRALLSFGLNMLANSGPSYTPRNFGQILATGLQGASESNLQTEQNRLKAQQVAATYALKAGQMKIQEYLAGMKGTKEGQEIAAKSNISKLAAAGGAGAPAAGTTPAPDGTTVSAPPATPGDFVSSNAPVFQDVAARTGFPVDFVAGQAGNESGWGTSRAATQGNNLFGLSDADGKPLSFPTRQAGIDAYVNLLNSRYKDVPRTGSNTDIGTALGKAGYNMTVPDYGARVGAAADQARRLLPQPTTTAPGTTATAPGTTMVASTSATVPASSVVSPAPSSAPPSTVPTVFGPGSPGWQTLPPAVLPDVVARKAEIEDTYQRDKAVAAASGNDTLLQKANQDRQASLIALNKQVTELQAAHQKAEIDLNAKQVEQQKTIAADAARNAATNQTQKEVEAAKAAAAENLARITAGQNWHQKLQEQAAEFANTNTIKPMGELAQKAHQMNLSLAQMQPLLQNLPKGGGALGFVLNDHPDLSPLFAQAGITTQNQSDTVQLINGLVSNIATEMKPTGLGALREYEWNGFKAALPKLLSTPDGQQKAVAMLMNMNSRIQDESSWMNNYFNRQVPDTSPNAQPGATVPAHNLETTGGKSAQQLMDEQLGAIVPSYKGPASTTGQAAWEQSLPPGKPYYHTFVQQENGKDKVDANGVKVLGTSLQYRPW